ncbi:hypothetical protein UK23_18040 [Lentzea aerocolonigenes]|uniref:Uncharacterized protein n=1 Tax=Lentzea aerocolonigenes TaxID=68170 RepID=A0A0F0H398_LENAE|nr:hypothetical protein UK23_18040 [Lentzea aerocolonigenes]
MGERSDGDVVLAACDLVVAGIDGPGVSALAGVSLRRPWDEIQPLLGDALLELGLDHHEHNSNEGKALGLRLMARRTLAGELSARELAAWVHDRFGHGLPAAEELARLDDEYDILEYDDRATTDVDEQVMAEVRRITS